MKIEAQNWPFDEPTNLAVFSIRQIVFDGQPILHVTHDSDDGSWQFLGVDTPSEKDAVIVGLGEIVELDPSLKDLSDLPVGWEAWRDRKSAIWKRIQKTS